MEYNNTAVFSCVNEKGLGNTIGCNLPGFNISLFVIKVFKSENIDILLNNDVKTIIINGYEPNDKNVFNN